MATATIARRPQALLVTETTSEPDRPAKRVKVEHHGEQSVPPACLEHDEADAVAAVPTHPLRVRPSGNAFGAPKNLRHAIKGPLILLPDAVLLQILENLDLPTLRTLGYTSKALWAFCHLDELWKSHYMRLPPQSDIYWRGSWRRTLLALSAEQEPRIDCTGLFSDALYRPFHCASLPLTAYHTSIPAHRQIPRFANLSPSAYRTQYYNQPFILTDIVPHWPVSTSATLSIPSLLQSHPSTLFRAESVRWPLATYISYSRSCPSEESPLYLFDHTFTSTLSLHPPSAFPPPLCYGEDLFAHLGPARPHSSWLIIGPARSGSTFHKDPNHTSAWNAVLTGRKYWLLFPPHTIPPGVHVSADESEVTSPLSIAEWLLEFHAEARRTEGGMEGVCGEGEVLHVPAGWWHLVVNLEESVALTGNFVGEGGLVGTLLFLRDRRGQVSGYDEDAEAMGGRGAGEGVHEGGSLYEVFVEKLRGARLEILQDALDRIEQLDEAKKQKQWANIAGKDKDDEDGGFSFGFGDDADEDE